MPFGEMKTVLEDVSCLLRLHIRGDLWDAPSGINEECIVMLVGDLLGVTTKEAT